eukprot:1777885-Rhodomonas_salina.2
MFLRASYAISGTDIIASYVVSGTDIAYGPTRRSSAYVEERLEALRSPIVLRARYAMSGTDMA